MPEHEHADDGGSRIGNGLGEEHALQLEKARQNEQEGNQENHLTAGVQEHGPERLSCTLEETSGHKPERNHEECRTENPHGPGSGLLQFQIVRGEGGDEHFGLPHQYGPSDEDESESVEERELEGRLHAAVEACAVVVSDNRLSSMNEPEQREQYERGYAVHDAECGNCHVAAGELRSRGKADVAVGGETPGENSVHEAVADLHD